MINFFTSKDRVYVFESNPERDAVGNYITENLATKRIGDFLITASYRVGQLLLLNKEWFQGELDIDFVVDLIKKLKGLVSEYNMENEMMRVVVAKGNIIYNINSDFDYGEAKNSLREMNFMGREILDNEETIKLSLKKLLLKEEVSEEKCFPLYMQNTGDDEMLFITKEDAIRIVE